MDGEDSAVVVDRPAPHVTRILIDRPHKRNAVDFQVRQALIDAFTDVLADPQNRALVFGGAGGNFSSGGDVPSMIGLTESEARQRMRHGHVLCRLIAGARVPVITAIEGIGAGASVGLALLGDYIVVGQGARILFPFMKLGLTPDWATLYSLPRRIGLTSARQVLMHARTIDGVDAVALGLADAAVADAHVMIAAVEKAVEFSKLPLAAFARMKTRLGRPASCIEEELVREENDQVNCLLGEEFREGHAALKEKRAADFLAFAPLDGIRDATHSGVRDAPPGK